MTWRSSCLLVIPGRPEGPSPESIITIVANLARSAIMDSGLAATRQSGMTESSFHPAHFTDELPFVSGHRLHRQAGVVDEHHNFQTGHGFGLDQRHRLG